MFYISRDTENMSVFSQKIGFLGGVFLKFDYKK